MSDPRKGMPQGVCATCAANSEPGTRPRARRLPDGRNCATCIGRAMKAKATLRAWQRFVSHIGRTYGLTEEEYRALHRAQGGKCYICHRTNGSKPLGVDHNHLTGLVRGLLCTEGLHSCNRLIGIHKDSPAVFRRAVEYLTNPPAVSILAEMRATKSEVPDGRR